MKSTTRNKIITAGFGAAAAAWGMFAWEHGAHIDKVGIDGIRPGIERQLDCVDAAENVAYYDAKPGHPVVFDRPGCDIGRMVIHAAHTHQGAADLHYLQQVRFGTDPTTVGGLEGNKADWAAWTADTRNIAMALSVISVGAAIVLKGSK